MDYKTKFEELLKETRKKDLLLNSLQQRIIELQEENLRLLELIPDATAKNASTTEDKSRTKAQNSASQRRVDSGKNQSKIESNSTAINKVAEKNTERDTKKDSGKIHKSLMKSNESPPIESPSTQAMNSEIVLDSVESVLVSESDYPKPNDELQGNSVVNENLNPKRKVVSSNESPIHNSKYPYYYSLDFFDPIDVYGLDEMPKYYDGRATYYKVVDDAIFLGLTFDGWPSKYNEEIELNKEGISRLRACTTRTNAFKGIGVLVTLHEKKEWISKSGLTKNERDQLLNNEVTYILRSNGKQKKFKNEEFKENKTKSPKKITTPEKKINHTPNRITKTPLKVDSQRPDKLETTIDKRLSKLDDSSIGKRSTPRKNETIDLSGFKSKSQDGQTWPENADSMKSNNSHETPEDFEAEVAKSLTENISNMFSDEIFSSIFSQKPNQNKKAKPEDNTTSINSPKKFEPAPVRDPRIQPTPIPINESEVNGSRIVDKVIDSDEEITEQVILEGFPTPPVPK